MADLRRAKLRSRFAGCFERRTSLSSEIFQFLEATRISTYFPDHRSPVMTPLGQIAIPQSVLDAIPAQVAVFRGGPRPGSLAFDALLRRAGIRFEEIA